MPAAHELAAQPAALIDALLALEGPSASRDASVVVRAPGRVNLIGEHTDYNDGLVLPAAIHRGISIAFIPTGDRVARLTRLDTGTKVEVDLDDPGTRDGSWRDYVAGTAWVLGEAGARIGGFRGVLAADLPMGAGLSSSAALELALAFALGGGEPPISDAMSLARAAQRAENEFVRVPCGLMDQFAVTFGQAGHALLLDCRSLEHEAVRLPAGVELLVCDSGVERRLAGSGYATRRDECRRAVAQIARVRPGITSLRDVDETTLESARGGLDAVAFRRARHVVTEIRRVRATVQAMRTGDVDALGSIFEASHASLRDDYEVSTPELDDLVRVASETDGVLGARLTGAGFGGATVNVVRTEAIEEATDRIRSTYRTPDGTPPDVLRVKAAAGAARVWPAA